MFRTKTIHPTSSPSYLLFLSCPLISSVFSVLSGPFLCASSCLICHGTGWLYDGALKHINQTIPFSQWPFWQCSSLTATSLLNSVCPVLMALFSNGESDTWHSLSVLYQLYFFRLPRKSSKSLMYIPTTTWGHIDTDYQPYSTSHGAGKLKLLWQSLI